jgi:hypothetical protein
MNKYLLIILLLCSEFCCASCELDEYTKYLNNQNESLSEASAAMSKADEAAYKEVQEFIVLHIRSNKLKIYTAKKLEAVGSELIDKSSNIPNLVKGTQRVMPNGQMVSVEAETLKNDSFYISETKALSYFNNFYLFGFKLTGAEREKWNKFSNARVVLNTYLEKTKSQNFVLEAFNKKYTEVCKL